MFHTYSEEQIFGRNNRVLYPFLKLNYSQSVSENKFLIQDMEIL